jgi:hypothetical protein
VKRVEALPADPPTMRGAAGSGRAWGSCCSTDLAGAVHSLSLPRLSNQLGRPNSHPNSGPNF